MSEEPSADELNRRISEAYGHLYDVNALLVGATRLEVEQLSNVRDVYLELADQMTHIIDMLVRGIALTAKTTGDILMAQYGVSPEEVDDDDDTLGEDS